MANAPNERWHSCVCPVGEIWRLTNWSKNHELVLIVKRLGLLSNIHSLSNALPINIKPWALRIAHMSYHEFKRNNSSLAAARGLFIQITKRLTLTEGKEIFFTAKWGRLLKLYRILLWCSLEEQHRKRVWRTKPPEIYACSGSREKHGTKGYNRSKDCRC